MSGLDGLRVAVTGAAGGIGRAVCEHLAGEGAQVFALDRVETDVAAYVSVDITDERSIATAVATVLERAGGVDGLVTAAGIVENVPAEDMPVEVWDGVMAVNLRGVFLSCRAFARPMLAAGSGRIVNIASISGNAIINFPQQQSAYNASKAAVSALTRSLAVEWGQRGVRVNAVSPGYVNTPLVVENASMHDLWKRDIVAGRFAEPAEVAAAIAYLLSDEAAYCMGTELIIDGGFSLR